MPAVPMPDAATEATLDAARSQAAGDLKGRFPDSMIAPPPPAQPKVTNSITNSVGQNLANAQPAAPPPAEPSPDAQAVHDYTPQEPSPDAVPVQDDNTMGRALKESAGQLGSEVGNGMMRAAASTARTLGFAASGVNNLLSDGADDRGAIQRDDAIFNFIKDYVDTAYDHWRTEGDTNAAAQFTGRTAEGLAPMMLGPGAAATMAANSTVEAGKNSVDAGDNTKTAVTLALIHGTAAAGQLAVGFKDPSIAKRIAKWVGAGEVIDSATDALTRYILNNEAYKRVVDQYKQQRGPTGANNLPAPSTFGTEYSDADPRTGDRADAAFDIGQQGINAITQTVFAILHTPAGQKMVKKADPEAKTQAPDMSAEPPAPPVVPAEGAGDQNIPPPPAPPLTPAGPTSPVSTGPLPGAKPATDKLGPKIPDQPSQEPVKDLNAQWRDMNDPKTPRTGVLIPKGVDDSQVANGVKQAAAQNRTLDLDQGTLVLKSKKLADKARAELAAGTDPQQVIGQITGAGDGKRPDQTAVVQGQTPEGAVATETAVAPHEVPGAVADVQAQGKTPVVTTPGAAVARRAKLVAEESGPGDNAVPVSDAADLRSASPSATQPTTEGVGSATPETTLKAGDRHIITIAGEEVPIVVAADPVGNKVGVHTIDDDGRVSKDVRQVPVDMFKKAEASAPTDRRTDTATRKKVSEMTPDETKSALLTDDLTQIPNSRAYEESDKKPTQVMVDANSLKYINDTGGHEAGDHLIKSIAQVLHEESGGNAYRKGGDEFVVQGDHPAHAEEIMARAKERLSKAAVELKSPDGRKLTVNGIGIAHGTGTSLAEADSALQREKLRQEAAGERAARGEQPPGLVEEGVQGNESHGTASELGRAAQLFDKENTPGPGRKFAGSVSEHAGRVAALGRALLEHLKTAKDLPDDVRAHAEAAGKRVARMDGKSEEALSKGQGVSHKSLDAWAADIKQAIHNIDHPGDVKIPPKVETKAAALKARMDKAKEIVSETVAEKVKAKQEVKVKSAIRDVEDMTKPKVLNAGERTKIGNALKRYLEVSDDELSHAHDNLERIVRDVYGEDRHAEGQQIIELARDQRADARGDAVPKRMSDTVDEAELQGHHYDADEQSRSDDEVHELQRLEGPRHQPRQLVG